MRERSRPPCLDTRLALRPAEAAEALGISERSLRQIGSELPRVHLGRSVVYPIEGLKAWLLERSKEEANDVDEIVRAGVRVLTERR